ncbi:MAG: hypothetical protein ABSF45_27690 [Terriglobia bacterium]|jgi:hypothetical protein
MMTRKTREQRGSAALRSKVCSSGGLALNAVLRFTWNAYMPVARTKSQSFALRQPAVPAHVLK